MLTQLKQEAELITNAEAPPARYYCCSLLAQAPNPEVTAPEPAVTHYSHDSLTVVHLLRALFAHYWVKESGKPEHDGHKVRLTNVSKALVNAAAKEFSVSPITAMHLLLNYRQEHGPEIDLIHP